MDNQVKPLTCFEVVKLCCQTSIERKKWEAKLEIITRRMRTLMLTQRHGLKLKRTCIVYIGEFKALLRPQMSNVAGRKEVEAILRFETKDSLSGLRPCRPSKKTASNTVEKGTFPVLPLKMRPQSDQTMERWGS